MLSYFETLHISRHLQHHWNSFSILMCLRKLREHLSKWR